MDKRFTIDYNYPFSLDTDNEDPSSDEIFDALQRWLSDMRPNGIASEVIVQDIFDWEKLRKEKTKKRVKPPKGGEQEVKQEGKQEVKQERSYTLVVYSCVVLFSLLFWYGFFLIIKPVLGL